MDAGFRSMRNTDLILPISFKSAQKTGSALLHYI